MAGRGTKKDPEAEVVARIAEMPPADRVIAEALHRTIRDSAPGLAPKLWYGQPAYARDGKVVVFFRGAEVDGERYLTLGFTGRAALDDGSMWPTSFAVTGVDDAVRARIAELVRTAVG